MMQITDALKNLYSEYGGEMPEIAFQTAVRRAMAYIRSVTYLRGDIFQIDSDMVRDAVCAAADVFYSASAARAKQQAEGKPGAVKSETNDGYSVTYVTEQTDGQTESVDLFSDGDAKVARLRSYSVIPDTTGDGTDALIYSGNFRAAGDITKGTATSADNWTTCTFTPDTEETEPVIGELTVTSAAGAETGKTKITVTPAEETGNAYRYQTSNI